MHHSKISLSIFIISHVPVIMLVLAFIASTIKIASQGHRSGPLQNVNICIAYLMFLAVGISGLWQFVLHCFFPVQVAQFTGWNASPFQYQLGIDSLGLGLLGIFSFRATKGFRLATVIIVTCVYWGAAVGMIRQMMAINNFHLGNMGTLFYTDIIVPLLLIILMVAHSSRSRRVFR